jgi:nicotinamidase-related amidase
VGSNPTPAALPLADQKESSVTRALVVVDIQNDYFAGGANPLFEPEVAAANARRLQEAFRASSEPVLNVQHVWDEPEATFMRPGTPGVEINETVAPLAGELVIQKAHPNSFLETRLEETLRSLGVDHVVVCGMMTSMCVDATARAASDLGFETTVVHDACATRDLAFGAEIVPARQVHAAFIAALRSAYATIVATDRLVPGV